MKTERIIMITMKDNCDFREPDELFLVQTTLCKNILLFPIFAILFSLIHFFFHRIDSTDDYLSLLLSKINC